MQDLTPIVLFTYNRPWHTRQVLNALAANPEAKESIVYVFCDGPKVGASEEDIKKIEEVRSIFNSEDRFREVVLTMHSQNKGLAGSVVSGVTEVINKHGKAIVLEDDIVTSPFFLQFMNKALALYEHSTEVACITGYVFPSKEKFPETFFLKGAECWGWATWSRVWTQFDNKGKDLLEELERRGSQYEFDYNGSYPHYQMLKDQTEGRNNSWAICWYAMAFLKNMLTLYPNVSLVHNIGFDGSGEHCGDQPEETPVSDKAIKIEYISPEESKQARLIVARYFSGKKVKTGKVRNLINRIVRNRRVKKVWDRIKYGGIIDYKNFTKWNNYSELLDHWGSVDVWLEFREFPKHWSGTVIDIGCGTGKVMQTVKEKNPNIQILGIEPGKDLVKQSRKNGIEAKEIVCSTFSEFLKAHNSRYKTDYLYSIAALQYFNLTELNELLSFLKENLNKQAVFFLPASVDDCDSGIFLSWQTYNRMSKAWWKKLFSDGLPGFEIKIGESKWKDQECYGIWLIANRLG